MVVYYDNPNDNRPSHLAWILASEWNSVSHWLQVNGYILGPELIRPEKEYVYETCKGITKFGRGFKTDVSCPWVWYLHELIPVVGHQLEIVFPTAARRRNKKR